MFRVLIKIKKNTSEYHYSLDRRIFSSELKQSKILLDFNFNVQQKVI